MSSVLRKWRLNPSNSVDYRQNRRLGIRSCRGPDGNGSGNGFPITPDKVFIEEVLSSSSQVVNFGI